MLAQDNGERIDMGNLQRPRRKREKKLMTMDEVNERFPLTKYKVWRAGREKSGLPAAGGITAPPSRAPSIREHHDLKRVSTEATCKISREDGARSSAEHGKPRLSSANDGDNGHATHSRQVSEGSTAKKTSQVHTEPSEPRKSQTQVRESASPGEEEDDPIQTAGLPADIAAVPGDQCAICIENLDDDDEVRGLSCGHAFHAGCLDPWLTGRRACCPLCKADFYVPKPRPEGTQANTGSTSNAGMPQQPQPAHQSRFTLGGRTFVFNHHGRYGLPGFGRGRGGPNSTQQNSSSNQGSAPTQAIQQDQQRQNRFLPRFSTPRIPRPGRRSGAAQSNQAQDSTTPGQLESGTR